MQISRSSLQCHYFNFFCKKKTAYEMRISDWSSDVCSSDLQPATQGGTDADGSESVTQVVVTLTAGELGWTLPDSIGAPSESPAGTWTFVTAGASLADVQSLVDRFQGTPPAGFGRESAGPGTTTTAEVEAAAGTNGVHRPATHTTHQLNLRSYPNHQTGNPPEPR